MRSGSGTTTSRLRYQILVLVRVIVYDSSPGEWTEWLFKGLNYSLVETALNSFCKIHKSDENPWLDLSAQGLLTSFSCVNSQACWLVACWHNGLAVNVQRCWEFKSRNCCGTKFYLTNKPSYYNLFKWWIEKIMMKKNQTYHIITTFTLIQFTISTYHSWFFGSLLIVIVLLINIFIVYFRYLTSPSNVWRERQKLRGSLVLSRVRR